VGDLDRNRAAPLTPETVDRLAREYRTFGAQYPIFAESGTLSDKSILQFLDTAEAINKVRDPLMRSDVAGSFQSLIGLWQIFVRQKSIAAKDADATFSGITGAFAAVHNERELFDASRSGIKLLLSGAPVSGVTAAQPQEHVLALLAGASGS